jgi:hypothetical protein
MRGVPPLILGDLNEIVDPAPHVTISDSVVVFGDGDQSEELEGPVEQPGEPLVIDSEDAQVVIPLAEIPDVILGQHVYYEAHRFRHAIDSLRPCLFNVLLVW